MRNTEEYRGYEYEDEDEEDEDEEYKEEPEAENPHVLAFRQEAKILDDWIYDRFENNLDLADGTWLSRDTRALCGMLREAVDNTVGKEQSEARTEVAEAVTKMIFQPLAEGTTTGKHIDSIRWVVDRIPELLEYIAEDQKAFQTFLADGKMDERDSIIGMHEAVQCSVIVAWTEKNIEMARDLHNPDMKECRELQYKEDEDEEYMEEREGESPHMLAFRQEAKMMDHQMYERFDDNLDMADGTWGTQNTNSLCSLLKAALDYTMGKEQSEARAEVAEAVTKMMFQPLVESTATGKHIHWVYADRIGDSEKQELLGYLPENQKAFQTFLADGQMDEWDSINEMHKTIDNGITITQGDIEMAREVHNLDMQE